METIVITGANRGIGFALTLKYLNEGSKVIATCRNLDEEPQLSSLIDKHHSLTVLPLNLTSTKSISKFCNEMKFMKIDILIHNAGVSGGDKQDIDELDYEAWRNAIEVHLIAPFQLTVGLLPSLRQSSNPRIMALTSQMGALSRKGSGFYSYRSSKAAANKMFKTLAEDLKDDGITVIPVHPGWVRTDLGGADGNISATECADSLFSLIKAASLSDSGKFLSREGRVLNW